MKALLLSILAALTALGTLPVAEANTYAQPQTQAEQIYIVRIDIPKVPLPNGGMATVTPTLINTGHPLHKLSVEVSLWRGGNFIDKVVYYDESLARNETKSFTLFSASLMPGTYTVKMFVRDNKGDVVQQFLNLGQVYILQ